jgi:Tol biopolymer transport system component
MPFNPGTRLGHYEIHSLRGVGGMGEVYRGRDMRLDRTVAIKVLPAVVASDSNYRQRFEREARAVAALSHPNICTLYDVGEAPNPNTQDPEPVRFLVMEYLDGDTLDEVLRNKTLPLDHVLRVAIPIADALDRAHRKGIVHRDLKPGNIMLTASGPKLLDFGLARTLVPGPVSDMRLAATVTGPLTSQGTILGTLHYMAPEQVEGKNADQRSDIFSFGTIVYEMTAGRKAFEGSSPASVMAAILEREPPPLPMREPPAPPFLDHVVKRCLAKDPDDRWQSAGDVKRELAWLAESGAPTSAPAKGDAGRWRERFAWGSALAMLATIAVLALVLGRRPAAPQPEVRLEITTPPTIDELSLAISPDGQKVVFVATKDGRPQLWLRALDAVSAQPLKGTDNAQLPFWSPDSRSIGFAASGQLKRLDLDGGTVRELASAPLFLGGTWNRDGSILFVPNTNSRVFRVADAGGDPVVVTAVIGQASHQHFPHLLPGGKSFLFYLAGTPELRGVYVANVDGTATRRVLIADAAAVYAPSGHLLFVRNGTLYAQRFDGAQVTGEAAEVVDHIVMGVFAGATIVPLSVSATGTIVYRTGSTVTARFQLGWFDRSGALIRQVTEQIPVALNPSLAPGEDRIAMFTGKNIWLLDLRSGLPSRFTLDPAALDFAGIWSPDGSRIIFCSNRKGAFNLYQKRATGAGGDELLLETSQDKVPTDWSKDGKFVLYRSLDPKTGFDIWALSLADRKAFPVVSTEREERDAQFSPDGKWIAYQSNETGRFEIWLRPFPFPGTDVKADDRWQVSIDGGTQVRWGPDGNELFYVALDGRLMAVPVGVTGGGQAIKAGAPVSLFAPGVPFIFGGGTALPSYMVARDGRRFLMTTTPVPPTSLPITVLLNWRPKG